MIDTHKLNLTAINPLVDKLIEGLFSGDNVVERMCYNPFDNTLEEKLSLANLNKIMLEHGDLKAARQISDNDNRFVLTTTDTINELTQEIVLACGGTWKSSGMFWYPPKSYCGWHTNNNREGRRVYFAWAEESDKSFFRYYDQDKDQIVTAWDKEGLNIHQFTVNKEKPCWHCVGSYTHRISFGFMLRDEKGDYNRSIV